ncbi:SH3 domain-containing protein [Acidipropionibacterium jensenii]|uniref:SH3 domain-containing protein n=1 Tax=Acidipropionibacterium jensenii TaxID=1749 RepID=UPI002648D46B|nr:SH3 domain-containing protein [Acidipropionibacterium jensenii]MDN5996799.1 SH3 domain-containing protein [Acidipropionibacterium jensenii]
MAAVHPVRVGAATLASAGLIVSGAQLLTANQALASQTAPTALRMPASPAPAAMPSPWMPTTPLPSASAKATLVYATTDVRVRASATTASAIVGVLPRGGHVGTRGASVNGWTPVNYQGTNAWISSDYLSRTKPATSTGSNGSSGSGSSGSSTPTSSWAALTANGSSGLSGLRPSAKGIVNRTITAFPQIRTIYGIRADSMADHPSGHAVDLMLPRGSRDAGLGQQIAAYFRAHAQELGVQYIMYNKQIWNISRDSEGWRAVADRGSETANHMDHVHITTIWD